MWQVVSVFCIKVYRVHPDFLQQIQKTPISGHSGVLLFQSEEPSSSVASWQNVTGTADDLTYYNGILPLTQEGMCLYFF